MAARRGMQAVELYEERAATDERALDAPSATAGAPATVGRRGRWRWWVLGAVVAAGLVATQGVLDAHARARDARDAAIPGVVARADPTLAAVRRVDERERRFVMSAVRVGDDAVGVRTDTDGSRAVVALDGRTGDTHWTYPLDGADAKRAEGGEDVVQPGSCAAVPGPSPSGAAARVACYLTDGVAVPIGGELQLQLRRATGGRLVVLDDAGKVVVDRAAPLGSAFTVTRSLLVVGSSGEDQHRVVTAQDLVTGAGRWTWETPTVGGVVGLAQRMAFQPFALGDAVGVALPGGRLVVLGADGTQVHAEVDDVWAWSADGTAAVLTVGGDATRVVRPGESDVRLTGTPIRATVDDGSLPDLVLTSDGRRLLASDARTGATRWQAAVRPQSAAVVLRGKVTILGSGALVVLDGRSGVTVAATPPVAGATLTAPTSDGRHVLVAQLGPSDGAATLVAYDPSGARAWSTALPVGTDAVQQLGRRLVVYDDAGLEVLGART